MTLIRPADPALGRPETTTSKRAVLARDHEPVTPASLPLLRQFVEEMIRDGLGDDNALAWPGAVDAMDWPELWESGQGSASLEEAVGRVAMAADVATTMAVALSYAMAPMQTAEESMQPEGATIAGPAVAAPVYEGVPSFEVPVQVPYTALQFDPERVDPNDLEPLYAGSVHPLPLTSHAPKTATRKMQVAYTSFGWVRNIGAILLLFAAWQVWGTGIYQHHAQAALKAEFKAKVEDHPPAPTNVPVTLVPSTASVPEPAEGSVVAELQIPSIGVNQFVVEGTAESDLSRAPGHYIGSAFPGQAGNVAIAGHRTTYGAPFFNLSSVTVGEHIYLTTDSDERLDYVVSKAPVAVSPKDVAVLNSFGDNRLTLTTCNPRYSSTQRLVVVAELDSAPTETPTPSPTATPAADHQPRVPRKKHIVTGFVGWRWSYLPAVLLMLDLLALLGVIYRRVVRHFGIVDAWVILAPIWAAGLYILFGLLSNFLPASI